MTLNSLGKVLFLLTVSWPVALNAQSPATPVDIPIEERVSQARAQSAALPVKDREAVKALFSSAFQLWKNGDFKAAQLGFESGLARDPANGIAHFYLAETLMRLNDRRTARTHYELAAALVPTSQEGLKAQALLASLPASSPAKFPNSVSKDVQDLVLRNSLFSSLPPIETVQCQRRAVEKKGRDARWHREEVLTVENRAGPGLLFDAVRSLEYSGSSDFGHNPRSSNLPRTLAGILQTAEYPGIFRIGLDALRRAEGSFFPLKAGNSFRLEFAPFEFKGVTRIPSLQCAVMEQSSAAIPGLALPSGDVYRVSCSVGANWDADNFLVNFSEREHSYLCSETLGSCPVYWDPKEEGPMPNLGAYSYSAFYDRNLTVTWMCKK